jgi:hypothetical protein
MLEEDEETMFLLKAISRKRNRNLDSAITERKFRAQYILMNSVSIVAKKFDSCKPWQNDVLIHQ